MRQDYPALNVAYQVANRRELIDYDYVDKLTDEEKKFLNNFTSEYYISNFEHDGEQLLEDRKEAYTMNNKRNVDAFAVCKANNKLEYDYSPKGNNKGSGVNKQEDFQLTKITLERIAKKNKK